MCLCQNYLPVKSLSISSYINKEYLKAIVSKATKYNFLFLLKLFHSKSKHDGIKHLKLFLLLEFDFRSQSSITCYTDI